VTTSSASPPATGLKPIMPALASASSFAVADILAQMTMRSGADVLTSVMLRGVAGVGMLYFWLRFGEQPAALSSRARWFAYGIGALFAGNVYALYVALDRLPVAIAILTYFTYPLFTGLVGAAFGIEKLTWRGATAAIVAFFGLALAIGAHAKGLSIIGLAGGITASLLRVAMLLITRAWLSGADARQITWHSFVSSTVLLALVALVTWNFHPPQSVSGWFALAGLSVTTTLAVFAVFVSVAKVGPFRTALFMNLEPLLAAILGVIVLGEVLTPLQMLGGAVMIAALIAFQMRR
jgi:probable blue pigment (indigoidine) exporter